MTLPATVRIAWEPSMSVGVPLFDQEHRVLLLLIEGVINAVQVGEIDRIMDDQMDTLAGYVEMHFGREETLMEKTGYPHLVEHKKEHDAFRSWLDGIMERHPSRCDAAELKEIAEYLVNYWFNHVMKVDMGYREFFDRHRETLERILEDYEPHGRST